MDIHATIGELHWEWKLIGDTIHLLERLQSIKVKRMILHKGTEEQIARVEQLRAEGKTLRQIAVEMELSLSRIEQLMRNIKRRKLIADR